MATAAKNMIILVNGQGDKAGEPEQHGQGIQGEDGELVGEAFKEAGGECEIWENQQGPNGDEDQKSDLGRDIVINYIVVILVGRYAVLEKIMY